MDLAGSIVAITGAAGSIGRALVKHLVNVGVKAIRAIDIAETPLHHLTHEHPGIRPLLADVRDRERMRQALSGVDVAFHCAALKHVQLGEYNASDLVATNVVGTSNVAHACHENGVKSVVLVSTDKASQPTSAMGASKMLAERVISDMNLWSPCRGVTVRFGNVFGSRGSVVPTLLRQLHRENKATITDPEATRFTLAIDRAAKLVVEAGTSDRVERGSIVILRMPAYRLDDLGFAIVAMWNETHPNAKEKASLAASALRYGEKPHECLISADEIQHATLQGEWFVVHPSIKGTLLPGGSVLPEIYSNTCTRVERPRLIQWVRAYLTEKESEAWE